MESNRRFERGRVFLESLPHGADLLATIEKLCRDNEVETGVFWLIGAVQECCVSCYDQVAKEYRNFCKPGPLEVVSCMGNISLKDGEPFIHAHILVADETGDGFGGHLRPGTVIFSAEAFIEELTGAPPRREFDALTGLSLWPRGSGGPGQ